MCILLVEGEWLIRAMVAEELGENGFAVREAGNSDQASALIMEDPALYTLLVTGIHMPGALDGIGVARLLRTRRPDVPVIYTTGRPDVLDALQPLGANEVLLCKPFPLPTLLAKVRRLLGQGGAYAPQPSSRAAPGRKHPRTDSKPPLPAGGPSEQSSTFPIIF